MIQRYNKILILFLLVLVASNAFAQQIKGVVTDSVTHEPLMYISVYYQEKRDMGTITNIDGEYSLEARRNGGTLVFSAVGYISKTVRVGSNNQTVNVKLAPDNVLLNEVVVKPKGEIFPQKQSGSGIHEEGNRTQKGTSPRSERVLSVRQVREDENV